MRIRPRSLLLSGAIVVIAVAALALSGGGYLGELVGRLTESGPPVPVHDLSSIDSLQQAFNHDAGTPRLILLVSPT